MVVWMWKAFLSLHKIRGAQFTQYYTTSMRMEKMVDNMLEVMLRDMKDKNYTMWKRREAKPCRTTLDEGTAHFEYLAGLE